MVATTDCEEKSKPISGLKVSKPIMEKKRRARINKCLDQLKTLLESYYSSNIRKRKLEKADILELTVKHLRNLQKIQSCSAAASDFSDHHVGFRSCLANVNQYLGMADTLNGVDRWTLSQLSTKLCRRGDVSSTTDSGPLPSAAQDGARRLLPPLAGPEEANTGTNKALGGHTASMSRLEPRKQTPRSPGAKQTHNAVAPAPKRLETSPSHKKCRSVSHMNEVANTQHNVWRPW